MYLDEISVRFTPFEKNVLKGASVKSATKDLLIHHDF